MNITELASMCEKYSMEFTITPNYSGGYWLKYGENGHLYLAVQIVSEQLQEWDALDRPEEGLAQSIESGFMQASTTRMML